MFVDLPNVSKLLATHGGQIDVNDLARILNRTVPSKAEIEKACADL
jgi:hypothetical protein